jgi:PAS domain S-box-containing protein
MNNHDTDLADQLQNERDFIDAVIQTSGALIIVIDKNGKIIRFNKTCEFLTGYTADEVIGRTVFDLFILPEERENVKNVASRLFGGERMVEFESHWVIKSAEKRYIRWRNSVLLDKKGVPIYVVATGVDISDRKKAEQALQESERRFRGIFDNIAMGIHLVDTRDHFIAANDYVCQMLGYSKEELFAMDVHHLTAPEDREKSDEMNSMIREEKLKRVAYEKHYLKADGSKFWVNVTVSSIRDDLDKHACRVYHDCRGYLGTEKSGVSSQAQ